MSEVVIQTKRLRLVLETTEEVLARLEAMAAEDRAQVSPDWLARVRSSTAGDPWTHGFSILDRDSGTVIGSCAFKGPPDAEGAVEIAYGVQTEHTGRGYATEAATALVDFAFGNSQVCLVRAHTQPANGASAQVLTKCGFEYVGEVTDPEDGLVWRWELHRGAA